MIKINVTGEMIKNAQDLAPCPLTHEEMRKMLGAAVRIVERDLNSVIPVLWQGRPVIEPGMTESTCIEVTR